MVRRLVVGSVHGRRGRRCVVDRMRLLRLLRTRRLAREARQAHARTEGQRSSVGSCELRQVLDRARRESSFRRRDRTRLRCGRSLGHGRRRAPSERVHRRRSASAGSVESVEVRDVASRRGGAVGRASTSSRRWSSTSRAAVADRASSLTASGVESGSVLGRGMRESHRSRETVHSLHLAQRSKLVGFFGEPEKEDEKGPSVFT